MPRNAHIATLRGLANESLLYGSDLAPGLNFVEKAARLLMFELERTRHRPLTDACVVIMEAVVESIGTSGSWCSFRILNFCPTTGTTIRFEFEPLIPGRRGDPFPYLFPDRRPNVDILLPCSDSHDVLGGTSAGQG